MEFEDYEQIFHRAFMYYKDMLEELSKDKAFPQILRDDLTDNFTRIGGFLGDFKDIMSQGGHKNGFRKDLCLALCCYVDGLEKSKNEIKEKVNGLNMEFKDTQNEIDTAIQAQKQFCPNDWKPKK